MAHTCRKETTSRHALPAEPTDIHPVSFPPLAVLGTKRRSFQGGLNFTHVLHRVFRPVVLALVAIGAPTLLEPGSSLATQGSLFGRPVRFDSDGTLISWSPHDAPYAQVARLAWTALETKFPIQDNGLETWLTFSRFDPSTFEGIAWPHNPASFYSMLTDSAALWYAFSGDEAAVDLARKALAYQIAHGTTPAAWDWARVPFASSGAGDLEYGGADDTWCNLCGRG